MSRKEANMKPTNKIEFFKWLIFVLFFLSVPSIGFAETGDIFSRFQPYVTVQEDYTNNLFLTPKNKKSDYITSIIPGLRFSTSPRSEITREFRPASSSTETRYGLDLDYNMPLVYYAKGSRDNYVGLAGNLIAWYSFDPKLTFRVRNYSIRSEEPRERDYSAAALPGQFLLSVERGIRPIYFRNVFRPSVEYRFGREDIFSIYYENNIYRNQSPLSEDSTENFINPRLTYWFNIRNGLSLDYGLTLGNFQRSPDLIGHIATGRYTYRFNPMTSVFGEYTFLSRDFKSPGIDYDVHRPSLGIEHAFSPTLSGRAQLGYFWQNPEKGSKAGGFFYDISATQRAERTTYTLLFQGGYAEDYFTAQNLGFTKYHRGIGTVTHRLQERMTVGLSGSVERTNFSSGQRDWIYGIWGNASYQILRWLTLSIEASHREDHSNIEPSNYSEYRGMFRITATY